MKTARGHFRFLHPSDYVTLLMNSDAGGLPQMGHDQDDCPFVLDADGSAIYLLVCDLEPKGMGMHEDPSPGTLRMLEREARIAGRPLPWLEA